MRAFDPKPGVSVCAAPDTEPEAFAAEARRLGLTAVELNADYIRRYGDAVAVLGESMEALTCHLPHDAEHSILRADPEEDLRVIERYRARMEEAAALGCRTFTFHLKNVMRRELAAYWDRSVNRARRMADIAAGLGAAVCVENCFPVVRDAEVARRFLDEADHPALGLTLDAGHFWSARCEDAYGRFREDPLRCTEAGSAALNRACLDMIAGVREKIFNLHVHNIRAEDWRDHQPVPAGVMEYAGIVAALREIGYARTIIIEIRPEFGWPGIAASAKRLAELKRA